MSTIEGDEAESTRALERLLAVCQDGVAGYDRAASKVPDPHLREELAGLAADRAEIAGVLVYALGRSAPPHHGSFRGAVHRKWLDAVAALERAPTHAVLRECRRGEQQTLHAFTEALGKDLTERARAAIQSQLGRVLAASALLSQMEDEAEAAGAK
jgi:uncharacterized protein (TIGR02284 family)